MIAYVAAVWWYWLLAVFLSWLVIETGMILLAHFRGERHVMEWTLSATVRRWSSARRWLAPITVGIAAFLLMHFFAIGNA